MCECLYFLFLLHKNTKREFPGESGCVGRSGEAAGDTGVSGLREDGERTDRGSTAAAEGEPVLNGGIPDEPPICHNWYAAHV